jgi:hypothetical protein
MAKAARPGRVDGLLGRLGNDQYLVARVVILVILGLRAPADQSLVRVADGSVTSAPGAHLGTGRSPRRSGQRLRTSSRRHDHFQVNVRCRTTTSLKRARGVRRVLVGHGDWLLNLVFARTGRWFLRQGRAVVTLVPQRLGEL